MLVRSEPVGCLSGETPLAVCGSKVQTPVRAVISLPLPHCSSLSKIFVRDLFFWVVFWSINI